jgi:ABC-type dipeptide/oligopeptide/nickel transport system permease subunit
MVSQGTPDAKHGYEITFDRELNPRPQSSVQPGPNLWSKLAASAREEILKGVASRFSGSLDNLRLKANGRLYTVIFDKEDIRFPFRPVKGHIMGIDGAGRDVFARILYGLRTSMTFGLLCWYLLQWWWESLPGHCRATTVAR